MFATVSNSSKRDIALLIALGALTLALFGPSIGFDYVNLDDPQYVFGNPHVLTGLSFENIRWAFTNIHEAWWLPALWISFMTDAALFGPEPWGFHLVNVLLHTANVLLVFWVLRRATGAPWTSAFVAAAFAIHPLRVESVAWITERKDMLSGLFFFLALLAYLRHAEKPMRDRMGLVAAWMLLGLLSKAILVVLPFLLLLFDYWPLRRAGDPLVRRTWPAWRRMLAEKIPLFLLAAIFVGINLYTHVSGRGSGGSVSWGTRLGLVCPNCLVYLGKIFWPVNLSVYYPEHDVVNWAISVATAAVLLVITGILFYKRRSAPYALVGWLWFLLALFPVLRGVRLGLAAYANRFVYLPSIGLAICFAFGFAEWATNHPRRKLLAAILALATLSACGGLTVYNLRFWKNSDTLFQRAWKLDPRNPYGITGRGNMLQRQERWTEALALYQGARPYTFDDARRCRMFQALALVNMNRLPEAFAFLNEALQKDPADPLLLYALGAARLQANQPALARIHLAAAIDDLPPTLKPLGRLELAGACFEDGDSAAANEQFQLTGHYDAHKTYDYPDLFPVYAWIWTSGERPRALRYFRKLAETYPNNPGILNNVAWILAAPEHSPSPPEEAVAIARKALAASESSPPPILDTLAVAQANAGDFDGAIRTTQRAIAATPETPANADFRRKMQDRLELYKTCQPYREKTSSRLF